MRTVLAIGRSVSPDTGTSSMVVCAERATIQLTQLARTHYPFPLDVNALPLWSDPDAVRSRGEQVRQALRAHPGLIPLLDHLAHAQRGQSQPLFIKIPENTAEGVPWETLCDANGAFLALDTRWPIGRISEPEDVSPRPIPTLNVPIKLLAVISAYGIQRQENEWDALEQALNSARTNGLPVETLVLTGDPDTVAAVQASINNGMTGLRVSGVADAATLVQDIVSFQPRLLHFFCHGHADPISAGQCLEVATASDFLGHTGKGSVRVQVSQIEDMLRVLDDPWLLTLNACSGAAASGTLGSIAHQAVKAGFPTAVAMVEPIDAADAHVFTRVFYGAALTDLKTLHSQLQSQPIGNSVPFEFVRALHAAREAICQRHLGNAANARQWTLPALFVRGTDPLRMQRSVAAVDSDAQQRLRVTAQWLQVVDGTLDEAARLQVMHRLLSGIPQSEWPDVRGTFR
jgi:hypothetical protein